MSTQITLRALARLLTYPDDALMAQLPDIAEALNSASALSPGRLRDLNELVRELLADDWLAVEARYVDTFDRGRRTSLHLFEHVHGDSRERGPAMIDLKATYAAAGLQLGDGELPDFLPVVLEYASTQPAEVAAEFLGEMAHILNALHSALSERANPYAVVVAAVLELAGEPIQPVQVAEDAPVDEAWAEPEVFGGCSSQGQQAPNQPQPIHIVRSTAAAPASAGVAR